MSEASPVCVEGDLYPLLEVRGDGGGVGDVEVYHQLLIVQLLPVNTSLPLQSFGKDIKGP